MKEEKRLIICVGLVVLIMLALVGGAALFKQMNDKFDKQEENNLSADKTLSEYIESLKWGTEMNEIKDTLKKEYNIDLQVGSKYCEFKTSDYKNVNKVDVSVALSPEGNVMKPEGGKLSKISIVFVPNDESLTTADATFERLDEIAKKYEEELKKDYKEGEANSTFDRKWENDETTIDMNLSNKLIIKYAKK